MKKQRLVYVQAKDGAPLMPCSAAIARILLKQGKAKVRRREPFTIRLLYETTMYTQPLTLGVDPGSDTSGIAVASENHEVVYAAEVTVRNDIKDRMDRRRSYRSNRRCRKTRSRKARFNNRKASRRHDRLSPTMISKLHAHAREIEYVRSILPITQIVIEKNTFDPRLLKNPALSNPAVRPWGYQKGQLYGFDNVKSYVRARDGEICPVCGKKMTRRHVHHIVPRVEGGSDDPDNLITICPDCHQKLHAGKLRGEKKKRAAALKGAKKGQLRHATQMNSICKRLLQSYPQAAETWGYVTSHNRLQMGLPKEHWLDAAVIATGGARPVIRADCVYKKRCVPEGDVRQTRGPHSGERLTTGKVDGLRKFDKARYLGRTYFIKGLMASGYAVLMDIEGRKVTFSHMPRGWKTVKTNRLKRLSARSSLIIDTQIIR